MGEITAVKPSADHGTINTSCNPLIALALMVDYLNSTYDLQAADTELESSITNAEAELVQKFEAGLQQAGSFNPKAHNYLYELEHLDPTSKTYSSDVQVLTQLLSAAQSKNQAQVKVMDGNNSTAQNVLSQNAQNQPGIVQAMSAINGIAGNLSRILAG